MYVKCCKRSRKTQYSNVQIAISYVLCFKLLIILRLMVKQFGLCSHHSNNLLPVKHGLATFAEMWKGTKDSNAKDAQRNNNSHYESLRIRCRERPPRWMLPAKLHPAISRSLIMPPHKEIY